MDKFMRAAVDQTEIGLQEGGIPIGAALVLGGEVVALGHNRRVQERNRVLHAEIDCFRNAGLEVGVRGATLYSILMPCYLCAGAAVQFGIRQGRDQRFGERAGRCIAGLDFLSKRGLRLWPDLVQRRSP